MTRRRLKLQVGDVFSVPIDDSRVGYGQIVETWGQSGGQFYFAVFDGVYPRDQEPDIEAVLSSPVLLLALSMDALLVHGHWQVCGNARVNRDRIPWPAYKEGVSPPGTFDVVDASGERRRRATEDEAMRLPFRTVVAPIRVEKAFRALSGTEDWDDVYESLQPVDDALSASALLPTEPR